MYADVISGMNLKERILLLLLLAYKLHQFWCCGIYS